MSKRRPVHSALLVTAIFAALFFVICTSASYFRWANFQYRTFDLAYYVQAVWQLIHGRFAVSVENVPLLGNHVEPIVFLFAPLLAVFRHPMLFVVVQNAALAAMGPIAYNMAKRLGFDSSRACLLSAALLLTPAAGFVALHEFHPEALAAPLLLLMLQARLSNSIGRHWLWFVAVLACKENMALLLGAYCVVQSFIERKRPIAELRAWYLWPLALAVLWFLFCSQVITPALNSGNINYAALYDRLGSSPPDILWKAMTQPQLIGRALFHSLRHGNLVWALLLPFLFLPLFRPRWILISAPILLQHLLSWRSSEWTIYFHYAVPLLPLFWMGAAEAIAPATRAAPTNGTRQRVSLQMNWVPWLLLPMCVAAQIWIGPAASIATTAADWFTLKSERARKNAFIAQIPPNASVVAPLPYLSHLAMREKLYSLHYILKGLKTLSRERFEPPPPTDFVLIDYADSATFDSGAGYYHPAMKTVTGTSVPSSDRLLHEFLKRSPWEVDARDELALFKRDENKERYQPRNLTDSGESIFEIGDHTKLVEMHKVGAVLSRERPVEIVLHWRFAGDRQIFPWMILRLRQTGASSAVLTKGLCVPEGANGSYVEGWSITGQNLAAGDYFLEAIFVDNTRRAWYEATGGSEVESTLLCPPVPLGEIKVER